MRSWISSSVDLYHLYVVDDFEFALMLADLEHFQRLVDDYVEYVIVKKAKPSDVS